MIDEPTAPGEDAPPELERARAWARLLDDRFEVAGLRFGLDGLLGLIPGVGALVSLAGGIVMLSAARACGLGPWAYARITGATAIDMVIGAIPVLGDLVDFVFKAHLWSLRLIERERRGAS